MPATHRLVPGKKVDLAKIPTRAASFYDGGKDTAQAEFRALRDRFVDLQRMLYAEGKQKLLIVLQAMDAGGKDGTIRNILDGVNPQGVRVASFKVPSHIELAHDFLWRVHAVVPSAGYIGVFNRSHYEDVLVVRVENIVPESVWRPRYDHINDFERMLYDSGTQILKFYLHISPEEQLDRLRSRVHEPKKQWKFHPADLEKRKDWHDYMVAYEEMLERCTTDHAPWHVIPSDQKWYRNLTIMQTIVDRLEKMDPKFPGLEYDPETIDF
jgi:PPK2 family polyphosphate:nucleotide phosphotransferase